MSHLVNIFTNLAEGLKNATINLMKVRFGGVLLVSQVMFGSICESVANDTVLSVRRSSVGIVLASGVSSETGLSASIVANGGIFFGQLSSHYVWHRDEFGIGMLLAIKQEFKSFHGGPFVGVGMSRFPIGAGSLERRYYFGNLGWTSSLENPFSPLYQLGIKAGVRREHFYSELLGRTSEMPTNKFYVSADITIGLWVLTNL